MQQHHKTVGHRVVVFLLGLAAMVFAAASCSTTPDNPVGGAGQGTGGAGGPMQCAPGQQQCGAMCANLASDPSNCGMCGTQCALGQQCLGSQCQCAPGNTPCPSGCVNLQSDSANCGSCGNPCPSGLLCNGQGACSATCTGGLAPCNGACVNTAADLLNCGTCGNACPSGQTCSNSACTGAIGGGGAAGAGTGGSAGMGTGGSTAGTGTGGSAPTAGSNGTAPPGYTTWGDWHGCAWTGKGEFAAAATMVTPQDFVSKPAADPFCISGSVGAEPEYQSVALLGFNVNEAPPADCAYKAADPNADGPPSIVPMETGIAVNFVKRGADTSFKLRIQLQGPNGHKPGAAGEADRWCYEFMSVQGKEFIEYNKFTPSCWAEAGMQGTAYAKQPISAVVFLVPGSPAPTPFDFCINGFADGTSVADAPDGPAVGGDQTGVVGGTGSRDLDFDRAKVNVGGKDYIIQNNNWGNPEGTDLILNYTNNSFRVTSGSGTRGGGGEPASFPSIYIGNNGNTRNGFFSTKTTDGLPARISEISSITSTFRYSGGGGGTVFNAAYDIWFANNPPTAEYGDGIDGFVMIWLLDPPGEQPIGSQMGGSVMIGGQPWNVWVGPRGNGPAGPSNAPVVSFVNPSENDNSRAQSFVNKNIKEFLTAAAAHGINSNMYLTDVFGGFEIWQGGGGANLAVDEFTCVVNK